MCLIERVSQIRVDQICMCVAVCVAVLQSSDMCRSDMYVLTLVYTYVLCVAVCVAVLQSSDIRRSDMYVLTLVYTYVFVLCVLRVFACQTAERHNKVHPLRASHTQKCAMSHTAIRHYTQE